MGGRRNERDNAVSNELMLTALAMPSPRSGGDMERGVLSRPGALESYRDARARRMLVKTFALFRRAAGISQTELAQRMSTSQSAISDIEKGLKDPRLSTLQRIARALGLELQVNISGYSLLLYSWSNRTVDYVSAVQPTRIEEGLEELWMAVLRDRQAAQEHPESVSVEPKVRPVLLKDAQDDSYSTSKDMLAMCLTQTVHAHEVDSPGS